MDTNLAEVSNSLSNFVGNLAGNNLCGVSPTSQKNGLYYNLRWDLVSNDRTLLSEIYVEIGIVQTLVDQPVDDAFRSGFEIKTGQLSPEEIEKLEIYLERHRVIAALAQAMKWARLFGGGALVLFTNQDCRIPLDIAKLNPNSPLEFRAVDMWELYPESVAVQGSGRVVEDPEFYDYYGLKVHKSRVYPIKGKEPPSLLRGRVRGWGLSVIETPVRSLNQFLKNEDVIYELLDEAKIDVFKIEGFNTSLMNAEGTNAISKRVMGANLIKNYLNALTMDKDDEYEQKQIAFTGLAEILTQIRQNVAADVKMPITKLFGMSAAGFSSGEDDIENYNSMIEGEIRSKCKYLVVDLIQLTCQKLFGMMPDDLQVKFKPLRILSAEQEEKVKDSQFNRMERSFEIGLASAQEAKQGFNKNSLLPVEVDETSDALEPVQVSTKDEVRPE